MAIQHAPGAALLKYEQERTDECETPHENLLAYMTIYYIGMTYSK